jgi:hypothetical protein
MEACYFFVDGEAREQRGSVAFLHTQTCLYKLPDSSRSFPSKSSCKALTSEKQEVAESVAAGRSGHGRAGTQCRRPPRLWLLHLHRRRHSRRVHVPRGRPARLQQWRRCQGQGRGGGGRGCRAQQGRAADRAGARHLSASTKAYVPSVLCDDNLMHTALCLLVMIVLVSCSVFVSPELPPPSC